MPTCPHGSEPQPGAPPFTWVNYRDLLGCNGGENEAWFCPLLIDFPNLLNFKNTESFCSAPQPEYYNISADDLLFNGHIPKLISNAEHSAWAGICQCKTPPEPPDEPPQNDPPFDKPFQVQVPNREGCTCLLIVAFWGGQVQGQGQVNPKAGRVPQGLRDGALYSDSQSTIHSFPTTFGEIYANYVYFAYDEGEPPNTLYYHYEVYRDYTVSDTQAGIINIPVSNQNPWAVVQNECEFCPNDEPEPPPDTPPPPDACCPVDIPEPPDLFSIYQRLDWLEAAIANLPLPVRIGTISVETEEIPYGVYERVENPGGGEE